MLARCSRLERIPALYTRAASHSIQRRPAYDLVRIAGVRHYAVRSKDKRRAIREARSVRLPIPLFSLLLLILTRGLH
jgi:hypothetical protein